jgi:excinuclease ABC subunit B
VSLVAILDADKEGFLRSPRSLVQTIGRAARNSNGQVIMYADRITDAMRYAIEETERRRRVQNEFNQEHGITPETIRRAILDINPASGQTDYYAVPKRRPDAAAGTRSGRAAAESPAEELLARVEALRQQMFAAAENLEFETAARLRDELRRLQANDASGVSATEPVAAGARPARRRGRASSGSRRRR